MLTFGSHDFCAFSTLSLCPILFLYCNRRRVCEEQTTITLPKTKPAGAAYIGGEAVAVTLGNSCLVPRHPLLQRHHLLEIWYTFCPGSTVFCKFTCRLIRANSHWKEMQYVQTSVRVCKENSITFWTAMTFKTSSHKTDCNSSQYFRCFTVTSSCVKQNYKMHV